MGARRGDATEKGERPGAEHIFVDPLLNPHADPRNLAALRSSMTLHDWATMVTLTVGGPPAAFGNLPPLDPSTPSLHTAESQKAS